MQAVMEVLFEAPYLLCVVVLGILTIIQAKGRKQFLIFGIMAIILGFGDAFHLIPRMYALLVSGKTNLLEYAFPLGLGKLITSITMTLFYVLLYHVYLLRYQVNNRRLNVLVYLLAFIRIILCLLPQNEWFSLDSPLLWGVIRNIPFIFLGAIIVYLFQKSAKKNIDKPFYPMWMMVSLSFLFYIPVVLFTDYLPILGVLMVPKTVAYVFIVVMGFLDSRRLNKVDGK